MKKYKNHNKSHCVLLITFFILMFVAIFCRADSNSLSARERKRTNGTQVEFTLKYDVNVPGNTSKIRLLVVLPSTLPDRQTIIQTKFSSEPTNILVENDNRYAEFIVENPPKHVTGEIDIKAEIYRYNLAVARETNGEHRAKEPNFSEYLKSEKFIEKDDPLIQQIAARITASGELRVIKAIHDYVIANMECVSTKETLGAAIAARGKKGDCSEYSSLFVALCRAKGIPARRVFGYLLPYKGEGHSWPEAYLKGYGWVPFDPTEARKKSPRGKDWQFSHLERMHLYLKYRDNVMDNGFYFLHFQGDKAMLHTSVEIKLM